MTIRHNLSRIFFFELLSKTKAPVVMDLEFKHFREEHFAEYVCWFTDSELNRQLGPIDKDWLMAVLSEPETQGITWAIFQGSEMVAVLEMKQATSGHPYVAISAIAVRPDMRRRGIGCAVMTKFIAMCTSDGARDFIAYIAETNSAAQGYVRKHGFVAMQRESDENGYIEYRLREAS